MDPHGIVSVAVGKHELHACPLLSNNRNQYRQDKYTYDMITSPITLGKTHCVCVSHQSDHTELK
jgi:hypothetical protein